ncbi:hypothetical protein Tel_09075 [Candidatus Tenderia electrophaga]|jgi:hypothetical protein|uniref:Uncharacterized protein n=1 Tax=Candidatus Tenderia electrophaga TaxID=1748243 RepID=A0A0S2TDR3_9GAMM|nr:hypothetical protein Tel_09075 [Candidatus Tenderia electrophaga]
MAHSIDPVVDNWYQHLDKGQRFRVVAVDQDGRTVELQHFDGDVEEVDFDDWYQMAIALAEPPESWAGATDIGNADDFGTEVTDTKAGDWNEPLKEFKTPRK